MPLKIVILYDKIISLKLKNLFTLPVVSEFVSYLLYIYINITVLKLIQKRGYYMGNFLPKEEYSMAAVMGLEARKIEKILKNNIFQDI